MITTLAIGGHQISQSPAFIGVVLNAELAQATQPPTLANEPRATKGVTVHHDAVEAARDLRGVFSKKADLIGEYVKLHVKDLYLAAA